ncbi:hypothetical protein GP475_09895 [Corynebacterium poyangense]|uniref:Uncharacterized protein n=1 Tax=Corynebacterium poyangense TaxID=2684405 RepID=A0A7H0SQT7_9CORY|nr:hypothetical protein [Corynebacterium poyangense]MBZ8178205.1 hypothetical protein [Corynebacterium poyangense]QNQ90912.1 hypothetical protein GP475_09895 [Corynebacterium poyangense]
MGLEGNGDHSPPSNSAMKDLYRYFSQATLRELEEILWRAEKAELSAHTCGNIDAADLMSSKGSWRDLIVFLEELIQERRLGGAA